MLRVAVIDPQPAVRAGLAVMLRSEPGIVPVGAAANGEEALSLLRRAHPDVVLVADDARTFDGLTLCRRIKARDGAPRVLLYTNNGDPELPLHARVAGADGIVEKTAAAPSLYEAIRQVARGGEALPPMRPEHFQAAASRVEPDDLALLAMLADRTSPDDAADALKLDHVRVGRRVERVLGRLRHPSPNAA